MVVYIYYLLTLTWIYYH